MRRRLAALALLVVLAGLAGCTSVFGPGEPDQDRLQENASYDWEANATVAIEVNKSTYEAVYRLTNQSEMDVYRNDALGRERYVPVSALQFRYPNGTTITADHPGLSASQTRKRTTLDVPNGTNGSVAFRTERNGKRFATPVFVEGSYEVTLPPSARVGIPLLSQVSPRGYDTEVTDDRMTVRWENVTSRSLTVRWYLQRDILLFTGIVIAAIVVGTGGSVYYYRQIRRLERRREQAGIDLDEEDDDPRDRGPPPGMK